MGFFRLQIWRGSLRCLIARWRRLVFRKASQMTTTAVSWFPGPGRGLTLVDDFIVAAEITAATMRAEDSFHSYG